MISEERLSYLDTMQSDVGKVLKLAESILDCRGAGPGAGWGTTARQNVLQAAAALFDKYGESSVEDLRARLRAERAALDGARVLLDTLVGIPDELAAFIVKALFGRDDEDEDEDMDEDDDNKKFAADEDEDEDEDDDEEGEDARVRDLERAIDAGNVSHFVNNFEANHEKTLGSLCLESLVNLEELLRQSPGKQAGAILKMVVALTRSDDEGGDPDSANGSGSESDSESDNGGLNSGYNVGDKVKLRFTARPPPVLKLPTELTPLLPPTQVGPPRLRSSHPQAVPSQDAEDSSPSPSSQRSPPVKKQELIAPSSGTAGKMDVEDNEGEIERNRELCENVCSRAHLRYQKSLTYYGVPTPWGAKVKWAKKSIKNLPEATALAAEKYSAETIAAVDSRFLKLLAKDPRSISVADFLAVLSTHQLKRRQAAASR